MSNAAINWAMQQTPSVDGFTSAARFVLVVLANAARDTPHVSKATGRAWPPLHAYLSVASICAATMQDRKTVMAKLDVLERAGLLERVGVDGQSKQVPVYRLCVTSAKNGTGSGTENGTGAENGTVPISKSTGAEIPEHLSQFRQPPLPKTGHETIGTQTKPTVNPEGERKPTARGTRRCPPAFTPSDEIRTWAAAQMPTVNVDRQLEAFRDHEFKRPYTDWGAAFKNWLRREANYSARVQPAAGRPATAAERRAGWHSAMAGGAHPTSPATLPAPLHLAPDGVFVVNG